MKYAHLADLHLGSWRDPAMRELSTKAFLKAIDRCRDEQVDFILFAGDIFNASLPSVDVLKIVTGKLRELKEQGIPLYVIAGSHDFSPSGKTMIDVLEHAGLLTNVCKGTADEATHELHLRFATDPKTGAKITGILGRKGQLDRTYYERLHTASLEQEPGYKIFMFHTTISEMKPKHLQQLEDAPASFLPKGFNYYAGGHIHHPTQVELPEYGTLTYPGALFPNNFAEVEKYGHGGFYLVSVKNQQQTVQWIPVKVAPHCRIILDCTEKTPEKVARELLSLSSSSSLQGSIVTVRLHGRLQQGKIADINFREIVSQLVERGAAVVMKNTAELTTEEFEEIKIAPKSPETVEEEVIKEHLQQSSLFDRDKEFELAKSLLVALNTGKKEGETVTDFQKRIESEMDQLVQI